MDATILVARASASRWPAPLAHLLGGDLTLRSVPGEGSVFTLRVGHLPEAATGDSILRPDVEGR